MTSETMKKREEKGDRGEKGVAHFAGIARRLLKK